ncbi:hypothetical protein CVT24_005382 [Panaeolus cyanescens]|uniref:Uncharacterized protein n=1 Tax=Panaeolus cyanescens TaxID=181874 RepID=A0A409Y8U7_9AGAR|nr:hypothetical protein CVT24_005382 [Panaeolus cyanescens]
MVKFSLSIHLSLAAATALSARGQITIPVGGLCAGFAGPLPWPCVSGSVCCPVGPDRAHCTLGSSCPTQFVPVGGLCEGFAGPSPAGLGRNVATSAPTIQLLLVLYLSHVSSTPLPNVSAEPVGPMTVAESSVNKRTLWSIIYTCLTTTLACTWISMHPNITQNKKWFTPLLMRLALSLYALFVPEAIVFWAATQWKAARDYEKKYKQDYPHWTISHAFFLLMGGFTLPNDVDGEPEPVPAHKFDKLLLDNQIKFPSITQNDILDKSKGDPLAKGFVVLQTFWFVAQCLARLLQPSLVITQLEVVTLALVPINAVVFIFWLKKPLSVKFAVPLEPTSPVSTVPEKQVMQSNVQPGTGSDITLDSAVQCDLIAPSVKIGSQEGETNLRSRKSTLSVVPPSPTGEERPTDMQLHDEETLHPPTLRSQQDIVNSPTSTRSRTPVIEANSQPPPRVLSLAKKIFFALILLFAVPALIGAVVAVALPSVLFAALLALVLAFVVVIPLTLLLPFLASMQIGAIGRHPEREAERKLPLLYAPPISPRSTQLMLAFTTVCATIFGGLHLIAWSFRFPTPVEELLWRISALALTVLPVIYFIYHVSQHLLSPYRTWLHSRYEQECDNVSCKRFWFSLLIWLDKAGLVVVWSTLFLLGIPLYSLARLYVLVEAFIALRDPTPGTLLAVDWIKFVPHF